VWSFSSTHRDASGGNPSESTGAGWPAAPSPSSGASCPGPSPTTSRPSRTAVPASRRAALPAA